MGAGGATQARQAVTRAHTHHQVVEVEDLRTKLAAAEAAANKLAEDVFKGEMLRRQLHNTIQARRRPADSRAPPPPAPAGHSPAWTDY